MTTPEIPPKTPSLSNLIDSGSLVPESARKDKPRPPIAPKPKGLRDRAKSVSAIKSKDMNDLKPATISRHTNPHTPPPKPPRYACSESSDDEIEYEEGLVIPQMKIAESIISPCRPDLLEEEYDLTPFQSTVGSGATTDNHHMPAVKAMSYPQPTAPSIKQQGLDQIITPRLNTAGKGTIEGYHELQAKHLPLFKSMTLMELSKKYAKFFPIKVQITEGHYGMSSKYSISTDDRFNLHFKKRMKQVTIQTYGEEYFIPLSSAIRFGLVYDPSDNLTVALDGHRFRRVADIIGTHPLPKLVCVMSSCSCSNDEFLEYNELLVVKKVKRNLFRGKPVLKVFSLLTMTKKLLPEEAIGDFTTRPLCLKMDLPQLLEHIPKPFPSKAMMYLERDASCDEEELPPNMFSWPVVLKEVKKHKSLVATLEKSLQLIDIPLQGNIAAVKANIVPPTSAEDIQELFRNTHSFLRQFDMTQVDTFGNFHTDTAYDTQNTLYRMVRGSVKGLGIEVMTPEALRKIQSQNHKPGTDDCDVDSFTSSISDDHIYAVLPGSVESDEEYEKLEQVRPTIVSTFPDPLESQSLEIDRTVPFPTPRKPPITPRARAETTQSGSGVFRFSRRDDSTPPSGPLTKNSRSVSLVQLPRAVAYTREQEENREYMKSLSIAEVSSLLGDMNLGRYKETFREQFVSGDVLADLTDNMLRCDLGVDSDLHRLRLLKVIRGEPSAHSLLKNSPSYCRLTKNALVI